MSASGKRRGRMPLLMCFSRQQTTEDDISVQPNAVNRKKLSKKVLLNELEKVEEELRREQERRENLEEQLKKERSGWIKQIEELEKLRRAEDTAYQVCLREQAAKMEKELEKHIVQIHLERDREIQQLEAATELEQERLKLELEKILTEAENERKRCLEMEREKQSLEEAWIEYTNSWAQKLLDKDSALEVIKEEKEDMERMVRELKEQNNLVEKRGGTLLKKLSIFHHDDQQDKVEKLEKALALVKEESCKIQNEWKKESESFKLQQRDSELREEQTRKELEQLKQEMDGMKTRFQEEMDRMVCQFEKEKEILKKERDGEKRKRMELEEMMKRATERGDTNQ